MSYPGEYDQDQYDGPGYEQDDFPDQYDGSVRSQAQALKDLEGNSTKTK